MKLGYLMFVGLLVLLLISVTPVGALIASDITFDNALSCLAPTQYVGVNLSDYVTPFSPTLTVEITKQPLHGITKINGPELSYVANFDYLGYDSFQYRVFDGSSYSNSATVTIHIVQIGSDHAFSYSTPKNTGLIMYPYTTVYSATDKEVILANVNHGTLNETGWALSPPYSGYPTGFGYTPYENYVGMDQFAFRDWLDTGYGGYCLGGKTTVNIEVTNPLVANDDTVSGWDCGGGAIMNGNILANDVPNSGIVPVLVNPAQNGSVELNSDGSVFYKNFGQSTSDSFTYRTFDGTNYSNEATVTMKLSPEEPVEFTQPGGPDFTFSTPKDTTLNGTFPLGPQTRFRSLGQPSHGTLIYDPEILNEAPPSAALKFQYIPDKGFVGNDVITFVADRDSGVCGDTIQAGTITIKIGSHQIPVPEFPSAVIPGTFIIGLLGTLFYIRTTREK